MDRFRANTVTGSQPATNLDQIPVIDNLFTMIRTNADHQNPVIMHFGENETIIFDIISTSNQARFNLSALIPSSTTDTLRRKSIDPINICIVSLSAEFVPENPVSTIITIPMALVFGAKSDKDDLWSNLTTNHTLYGQKYTMSRLQLIRLPLPDDSTISTTAFSKTSTPDEIGRLMTYKHLRQHCTTVVVMEPPRFGQPSNHTVLIPRMDDHILPWMLIGMDSDRMYQEYFSLRVAPVEQDTPDMIHVPLFRRIATVVGQSGTNDTFACTIIGFWIKLLMDIAAERRPNNLPREAITYASQINDCVIIPLDNGMYSILVPRRLVIQLHTTLLARLADESSSRIHRADKPDRNGLLLFKSPNTCMDHVRTRFTMIYRAVTVIGESLANESIDSAVDSMTSACDPDVSY